MKAGRLRAMTGSELLDNLLTMKKEAYALRTQNARMELSNTARLKEIRRDTARILTVMRERELAGAASDDGS